MDQTVTAPPQSRIRALGKTEKLMVRAMNAAWTTPMFPVTVEIDMTAALARRAPGVTLTDVILADCAAVLADHPALNAHWQGASGQDGPGQDGPGQHGQVAEYASVNLGLAVASDRGLTVPVIHDAQALTLQGIAARRKALVDKVRAGRIGIAEVMGATFTVSNLGMFGVSRFTAIINPPQVAILAVGGTIQRQIWNDGAPVWRPMAEFTLTSDHRAVDGARAAAFLADLRARLETGARD